MPPFGDVFGNGSKLSQKEKRQYTELIQPKPNSLSPETILGVLDPQLISVVALPNNAPHSILEPNRNTFYSFFREPQPILDNLDLLSINFLEPYLK
jgi:hypothetical protein